MNVKTVLDLSSDPLVRVQWSYSDGQNTRINYHMYRFSDDLQENGIFLQYREMERIIDHSRCLKKNVLIHCTAGKSRSPTVAIMYMISNFNMGFEQALRYVKSKGVELDINLNFIARLITFAQPARHPLPERQISRKRSLKSDPADFELQRKKKIKLNKPSFLKLHK
ncbi:hypothetical protein ACOME3_001884 [Neoechinorhynchus agilis]